MHMYQEITRVLIVIYIRGGGGRGQAINEAGELPREKITLDSACHVIQHDMGRQQLDVNSTNLPRSITTSST